MLDWAGHIVRVHTRSIILSTCCSILLHSLRQSRKRTVLWYISFAKSASKIFSLDGYRNEIKTAILAFGQVMKSNGDYATRASLSRVCGLILQILFYYPSILKCKNGLQTVSRSAVKQCRPLIQRTCSCNVEIETERKRARERERERERERKRERERERPVTHSRVCRFYALCIISHTYAFPRRIRNNAGEAGSFEWYRERDVDRDGFESTV